MSVEKKFFDKENFNKIVEVVKNDIILKFNLDISRISNMNVNIQKEIFDSMNIVWNSKSNMSTLSELNVSVLDLAIPILYREIINKSRNKLPNEMNEKLKETPIRSGTSISTQQIEKDVDINSADRKNWALTANTNMTPYRFSVVLGPADTFEGISTGTHLKNVVGANMTHIIIADNDNYSIDKYPYLYLQIQEFQNVYQSRSTSHHGELSFAKLIRDKKWDASTNSNIRYNILNTRGTGAISSTGFKVSTPISNITKLTFEILTPNGTTLKSHQDIFGVEHVSETTETLEIKMNARFVTNALHIDNVVGFQNLNLSNGNVSQFLQENEHVILSVTDDRIISLQKKIVSRDAVTGTPTYEDFGLSSPTVTTGSCMNFSMQTNIGLNIQMIRANNDKQTIYEM